MCDIWLHYKALTSTDLQVTWKCLYINDINEGHLYICPSLRGEGHKSAKGCIPRKRMFQEGIVNSTQTFSEIKIKIVHWILYKFIMTFFISNTFLSLKKLFLQH